MPSCWRMAALFFILSSILLRVSTISPDDANPFCTTVSNVSTQSHPPPIHPPNSKILLDSYNYINLLPPHDGPVWQTVDNDTNNEAGRGTSWTQNTNIPCRQRINVCGFSVGSQNNWLITQYIRRPTLDLTQVSILVEFELVGCTDRSCEKTFVLNKLETSDSSGVNANDTSRYQTITRVATSDDTGLMRQNRTEEMDFDTQANGFHLAIVDESTCIGVSRVIVFYSVCPAGVVNLVNRTETLAPRFERISQPFEVTVECVEGASPENGVAAKLSCNQGGTWFEIQGSGCRCNPGLEPENGTACGGGCEAGMFLSESQGMCIPCPENTVDTLSGVAECPCIEDYFRRPEESEEACTRPPTQPENVEIVSVTSNSVTLSWDPVDDGGRDDLVFVVSYQIAGTSERVQAVTVEATKATVTGLTEGVTYEFFVSAKNGVSDQVPESNISDPSTPPSGTPSGDNFVAIIVGVIVSLLVIVLIIICVAVILYRMYYVRGNAKYLINSHEAIPIPVTTRRTYVDPTTYASPDEAIEEFAKEIEPKNLRLDAEIGAGEFGTVFRGIWKEQPKKQVPIAVKTLKPGSSGKLRTDFLNEASIMGQFNHDHVIKLYGVVTKVDPAMIVMEFMDNGSLYSYLRKNDEKLNLQRLLKMARCVCSGMEYLSTVGYVHRDLAARNVLVSKDEVCKVADFGLSRDLVDDEYTVQKGGKIPVRWTAPEAIYRRKFTSSSDVWSFGVLMWEVMTYGQHPYDDWGNQDVLDQVEAGYRLEKPHECTDGVYEIMLDCWDKELSRRPTFTEILKRLDLLLNTESPPKRPPKKMRSTVNSASNPLQCKTVEDWLESVKMERYVPVFQENGITSVNQLVHLTEPDLREMGITLAGHLHKLTQSIESGYMELKRTSSIAVP